MSDPRWESVLIFFLLNLTRILNVNYKDTEVGQNSNKLFYMYIGVPKPYNREFRPSLFYLRFYFFFIFV